MKTCYRLPGRLAALAAAGLWLASAGLDLTAATYRVATTGNDGNDGHTWPTAWLTISNAIAQAAGTDTILVSNGIYNISRQIVVDKGVILLGIGGAVSTIVQRAVGVATGKIMQVSHAGAYVDGFTLSNGLINVTTYHVPAGVGLTMSAGIVTNCIIVGNKSTNINSGTRGIGAYVTGGLLTDSIISNNVASPGRAYGCGLFLIDGTVANCRIEGNYGGGSSDGIGGGVMMLSGLLTNCIIHRNTPSGTTGGGVSNGEDPLLGARRGGTVADCIISSNTAIGAGGLLLTGTGTVQNCTIASNVTTLGLHAAVEVGGGIMTNCSILNNSGNYGISMYGYAYFWGENPTAIVAQCTIAGHYLGIALNALNNPPHAYTIYYRNCTIRDNGRTYNLGGGIRFTALATTTVKATFDRCTIVSNGPNTGDIPGGGANLTAVATNVIFRNCLIANNAVPASLDGGGLYMLAGTLESCTIASNRAGAARNGGGIWYGGGAISNCIIYHNSSGGAAPDLYSGGGNATSACYYSCSPSLTNAVNGNITNNPLFVDLANANYRVQSKRGHWTATGWINDAVNSPCIDKGPPGWAYEQEPAPNGRRINMGYDANTAQASKSTQAGTVFYGR